MKNLRTEIDKWLDGLDKRWEAMPIRQQHHYIRCFFTGYVLLTGWIIFKVCLDTAQAADSIPIGHIENPVPAKKGSPPLPQDTVKRILKNKLYEKK